MQGEKEDILIQAYLMTGDMEKADYFTQIVMFKNVLALVVNGTQLMMIHGQQLELCEKVMKRIDAIIEAFQLEALHPNSIANYQYQAAITYCIQGKEEETYQRLESFVELVIRLLQEGIVLHGDDFFNRLDTWFEELDLGAKGVRTGKFVIESAIAALENLLLATVKQENIQELKSRLMKEEEKL